MANAPPNAHSHSLQQWLGRLLPAALALGVVLWIAIPRIQWYSLSDEEKLTRIVQNLADAAERRHVGDILVYIDESYTDRWCRSREDLANALRHILVFRWKRVACTLHGLEIHLDPAAPDTASATFRAEVLASTSMETPPTTPYLQRIRGSNRFRLHFQRGTTGWLIISSEVPE